MSKAVAKVAAALGVALLLTGCWDRIELPDLEMVTAAAFDAAPNGGVRVAISIVLPANLQGPGGGGGALGGGGGGAGAPATAVISEQGATLGAAIARLGRQLPGHIFWGHTRVVLIGAGLAQRGIASVVDFFMRDRTTRLSTDMVVTPEDAGSLLTVAPPYRTPGTDAIYEALRQRFVVRAPAFKVAESLLVPQSAILIPEVAVARSKPPAGSSGGSGTAGGSSQANSAITPIAFEFNGAGVFEGGRLRGWLDVAQMRGALWLTGRRVEGTTTIDAPDGVAVTARLQQVRFLRSAIRLPDGALAVQVEVDASDGLTEVDSGQPPLDSPQYLLLLSHLLADQIRQSAESALAAAHAQGVDFLGFGRLMAEYQPTFWRSVHQDWPATFRDLPVVLRVRAHVRSTGNLVNLP